MKKFAQILSLALALTAANTFATSKNPVEDVQPAMTEIYQMLGSKADFDIQNDAKILVVFTVNADNEVAILKVDTQNEDYKDFIKSKINNRKLKTRKLTVGQQYQFFVKMKK